MAKQYLGLSQEEEDEYRRKLLSRARKGDLKAQDELMAKYGMRVYSDTEKSKMPTYYDSGKKGSPPSLTSASPGKPNSTTKSKKRPKTAAKAKKK